MPSAAASRRRAGSRLFVVSGVASWALIALERLASSPVTTTIPPPVEPIVRVLRKHELNYGDHRCEGEGSENRPPRWVGGRERSQSTGSAADGKHATSTGPGSPGQAASPASSGGLTMFLPKKRQSNFALQPPSR